MIELTIWELILYLYITGALGIFTGFSTYVVLSKRAFSTVVTMLLWPIFLCASIADGLIEIKEKIKEKMEC